MVRFSLVEPIRSSGSAMLVGVLVLGACSGSEPATIPDAEATTVPAVFSDLDGDTTDPASAISTAAPEVSTTTEEVSSTSTSSVRDEPVLPHGEGSGCVVQGDTLSDGRWFGYIAMADGEGLSFDLACWFIGEDANTVAALDGEESPVPNDYYIRNQNPQLRYVPVDPAAAIMWLPAPGSPDQTAVDYPFWVANAPGRPFQPGVWIEVMAGAVVTLTEQYTP